MPFDFQGAVKEAEKEGLISGGDRFKLKEGANRVRVLSEPLAFNGTYQGRRNFKWLLYIIDRADGQVKLFFCPHSIFKQIGELQASEDYRFYDVPMPYDITVNAKGAGTKEVEYTVVPAKKEIAVTSAELEALSKKKPLREIREKLLERQAPHQEQEHFDPDEIPT